MKKTFSGMVEESRGQLDIIDSHALNKMIENKEDMVILDVNDKEDVEQKRWASLIIEKFRDIAEGNSGVGQKLFNFVPTEELEFEVNALKASLSSSYQQKKDDYNNSYQASIKDL